MSDKATTPFDKIIYTERCVRIATNDVLKWAPDRHIRDALIRAQFLLAEVRFAAQTLCDPACSTHDKNEAITRLEQAIINCD